jgi:hypothetical protein
MQVIKGQVKEVVLHANWDFAGPTDMWSTSAGGYLMKVVKLTGFTVSTKMLIYKLKYSFANGDLETVNFAPCFRSFIATKIK